MYLSRRNRWTIRAFCAVVLFFLTLAASGVVQAIGAGTPCNSCSARCYEYYAGRDGTKTYTDDKQTKWVYTGAGCRINGMPDTECLKRKCYDDTSWCDNCINTAENYIDCENANCWESGLNLNGGNVCSNGCYGAGCAAGSYAWSSTRKCGQVDQQCGPADSSVACTKCGCQP